MADCQDHTPLAKICANITSSASSNKPLAVLINTGSLNPMHRLHIGALEAAKQFAESELGFNVVGGFLGPSHDDYVRNKLGKTHIPFKHRVAMCRAVLEQHPWIDVDEWEGHQPRFVDFPEVAGRLQQLMTDTFTENPVQVIFVCGSDLAKYCSLGIKNGQHERIRVLGVLRPGSPFPSTTNSKNRFCFAVPCPAPASDTPQGLEMSSSEIRRRIARGQRIDQITFPVVEDYMRRHRLLGMSPAEDKSRIVFISASAMARAWKGPSGPKIRDACEAGGALLFFGSKRSWMFPSNADELAESRRQGNYENFPPDLIEIVRRKLDCQPPEVHFLKPESLQYRGFGSGCHARDESAPVFTSASRWLQSHGFEPLILDEQWWLGKAGYNGRRRLTGVSGKRVVENFLIGEHDYDPCMELLWQSQRGSLRPCLNWPPPSVKPQCPRVLCLSRAL